MDIASPLKKIGCSRGLFLEGPGNLTGSWSGSVFIQDEGHKNFENYAMKLSARKKTWTGSFARTYFSILKILILKYGFGSV